MSAPPGTGMERGEMKQMLNKAAPDNPISFAFGIGKDPAFAMLMMHKSKAPKAVDKELEDGFPDTKGTRWGTVIVAPDHPNLAKFTVNKPVSGMAKRLVKTLKGTGFSKVEILLEDGTVIDGAADEEEIPADHAAAPPPPPPPPGNADALKRRLAVLVKQMPQAIASQPSRKDALMAMARDAQAHLAASDLAPASTRIDELEAALGTVSPPPDDALAMRNRLANMQLAIIKIGGAHEAEMSELGARISALLAAGDLVQAAALLDRLQADLAAAARPAPSGPVAYAKSRLAWLAVRRKIESDLQTLRDKMLEHYGSDDSPFPYLDSVFDTRVAPILSELDERLADALDDATNAEDPQKRETLIAKAHGIIKEYQKFVASDRLFKALDANPFVPLSTVKTVSSTLATLAGAIH